MEPLIIFLAQTKTAATLEIIALLLVAAIIGFIAAWLYYRSECNKKIKILESEKDQLKNQITKLNEDNDKLKKSLREKEKEIENLTMEMSDHKEHPKASEEETLGKIAQRKSSLDYSSFGMAAEGEKDDLKLISGIGPFIEKKLNALDIYTFRQISKFTSKDIEAVNKAIEFFPGRIERDDWVAQAKELLVKKG